MIYHIKKNFFYYLLFCISIALFFIYLPGIFNVNFIQNDEWVYYRTLENYLDGRFVNHPRNSVVFYSIGFLVLPFVKLWTMDSIPIITFGISVANFVLLSLISYRSFRLGPLLSILIGLLLFFNPVHIYSSIGFMSDNYLLFYSLLSLFFYFEYKSGYRPLNLFLAYLFGFLGVLAKDFTLVILIGYALDQIFLSRTRKYLKFQLVAIFGIIFSYLFLFPKPEVVLERRISFDRIDTFAEIIHFPAQWLVYLGSFTIPLAVVYILKRLKDLSFTKKQLIISVLVFLVISVWFAVTLRSFDYPYMHNTFRLNGFFPLGLNGQKYHFIGYFDLFRVWKIIAILATSAVIALELPRMFKNLNFTLLTLVMFIGLLYILPKSYDRYLLIPTVLLVLWFIDIVKNSYSRFLGLLIAGFVLFNAIVSTMYFFDFIVWQNTVWNRAERLVKEEGVDPQFIMGSHGWTKWYEVCRNIMLCEDQNPNIVYKFTFDDPVKLDDSAYKLIEEYDLDLGFTLFLNPKVYLYEKI